MLTIFGLKVSYETLLFLALFIASEVVASSKLKENSIVQLAQSLLAALRPLRKEDDLVNSLKQQIESTKKDLENL